MIATREEAKDASTVPEALEVSNAQGQALNLTPKDSDDPSVIFGPVSPKVQPKPKEEFLDQFYVKMEESFEICEYK